jgi:predicted Zn-dependent peptidase
MVFKGTEKRPRPGMISEELDALGAAYNAFTSQEYTGYWAKAASRKLPQLLELIADLYLNPTLDSKEIEKERGVIIEEINMYEDMPMRRVQEVFSELLYGNQPAGWSIAGKKEVVAKMKRADFVKYRDAHYSPKNTVVVISGKFSAASIEKQLRSLFKSVPGKKVPKKSGPKEVQKSPAVRLAYKKSDQSHLVIGVRTFSMFDKRRHALEVMSHLLGGGMSSRLFHRIREELGAAYYVRSSASLFLDHGTLDISAGVNHPKLEEVAKAILEECAKLTRDLVPATELRRVKDHLLGNFLLGLETSDEVAGFYGDQELLQGKMISPAELSARIEAVRAEDIQKLAKEIFKDASLNMAVIGPLKNDKPLKALLHFPK